MVMGMNVYEFWFWLALGLIPYRVKRYKTWRGNRRLEIRALFWSLNLYSSQRRREWTLRLPLIEHLQDALLPLLLHLVQTVLRQG